jgi:hypothetical protein
VKSAASGGVRHVNIWGEKDGSGGAGYSFAGSGRGREPVNNVSSA